MLVVPSPRLTYSCAFLDGDVTATFVKTAETMAEAELLCAKYLHAIPEHPMGLLDTETHWQLLRTLAPCIAHTETLRFSISKSRSVSSVILEMCWKWHLEGDVEYALRSCLDAINIAALIGQPEQTEGMKQRGVKGWVTAYCEACAHWEQIGLSLN